MQPGNMNSVIDLFQQMIKSKNEYIQKLMALDSRGASISETSITEIINREQAAIDNLNKAIENAATMAEAKQE